MKCDTYTPVYLPRTALSRRLRHAFTLACWGCGWAALSIGCSSRVPYEPDRATESDREEQNEATFAPTRDAQPLERGQDASLESEESDPSETLDGGVAVPSPTADGDLATATLPANGAASNTIEPTVSSAQGTASIGGESLVAPIPTQAPVPTQQLSIPLPDAAVKFAILVSVDGLAARFLEQLISTGGAPTFAKLQQVGAWTHNARTDKTHTYTLPNHTCMLTGLPVQPVPGLESYRAHFYVDNVDPAPSTTLHQLRFPDHAYTPSMFDVAHDHGLKTAMFASKTKFSLFSQTYNDAGGPDTIGVNNGPQKIDQVVLNPDAGAMVTQLVTQLRTLPPHLTFVHLNQPDAAGHTFGWGSPEYLAAVSAMDQLVGQILTTIEQGQMRERTALIVTTDHGGVDYSHLGADDANNYQIPFYVFARGVAPGDLYASLEHRVAPGADNPDYDSLNQPLRNGDSGNLALDLLGLSPIPESVMHTAGILTVF